MDNHINFSQHREQYRYIITTTASFSLPSGLLDTNLQGQITDYFNANPEGSAYTVECMNDTVYITRAANGVSDSIQLLNLFNEIVSDKIDSCIRELDLTAHSIAKPQSSLDSIS